MNSRERVSAAINHKTPDRVPIDLGATGQTGISVSALYKLRKYYGLEEKPLDVFEIIQMLGVVDEDLRKVVGADVIGMNHPANSLGVPNGAKQIFKMPDGTPTYIAAANAYDILPDGGIKMYPQGDRSAKPSTYMPAGGYFFDIIDRSTEVDEDDLTPVEDFKNLYSILSDDTAKYFEKESKRLFETTEYAIIGNLGGGGLGDPGYIPGAFEKSPRGIRKFDEWMMAQILYPEYVESVFEYQTEIMLKNLEIYKQAVGDRIQIVWISGTDFGTQNAGFFSTDIFQSLYKPYYKRMNDWVHQNTNWKTFYHTCGSVVSFLDDFVEMGMDIINPVQLSATGMDAKMLKHIFCEKPLSISAAESKELAEMAAKHNVVNYVGYNKLTNPATAYIRNLIQSGKLGQLVRFTGTYDQDMLLDPQLPITWRHINKFAGCGSLGDLGSHLFSVSQTLMGDIEAVSAIQSTVIKERPKSAGSTEMQAVENDDLIQILVQYKNGAIGTLGSSRIATGRKNFLSFEIQGTLGTVFYNLEKMMEVNVYFKSDDPADRGFRTVLLNPEHGDYGTFFGAGGIAIGYNDTKVVEFHELFAAVLDGKPYTSTFDFGYRVDRTIAACIESAKTGQWVKIG